VAHVSGDVPPDAVQATGQAMTVIFTTDGSVTREGGGFAADFSCPTDTVLPPGPPDACTTGVTLTDGGGFSKSNYGHGHLCTWLLTCTDRAAVPLLTFSSFNTETNFDFVTLYRGTEASDSIIGGPWSGQSIPDAVAGDAGSSMLVEFTSDESVARDGFVASYSCTTEAVPPPPPNACIDPGMTMVDAGVIDQAMYFHNGEDLSTGVYTHNLECRWLLTCSDQATTPTLTFRSFATEANFDFVRAYDGADTNAPQLSPGPGWSGNDLPSDTQGTGTQLLLQFTTDGSVSAHGWSASFGCQAPPPPPAPTGPTTSGLIGTVLTVAAEATRGNTLRLVVSITGTRSNVYAMAGTSLSPMHFPAGYQVATPFGVDIGGVNPAFFGVMAESEFDSWLTIGMTGGNTGALSSIGVDFTAWTAATGIGTTDGAVFYMDPTIGPSGADIVMAQITSTVASGYAHVGLQGRSTGDAADWDATVNWSW